MDTRKKAIMKRSLRQLLSASLVTAAISSPAMAQSPSAQMDAATRINAANAMLRDGEIQEALSDYRQIQPTEVNRDQLNYNMAVAQFRDGDIEAANALFSDVSASSDSTLAFNSELD